MIILDSHIWVWDTQGDKRLKKDQERIIRLNESIGIGISAVSLWEVGKAVELKRLFLSMPVEDWFP